MKYEVCSCVSTGGLAAGGIPFKECVGTKLHAACVHTKWLVCGRRANSNVIR